MTELKLKTTQSAILKTIILHPDQYGETKRLGLSPLHFENHLYGKFYTVVSNCYQYAQKVDCASFCAESGRLGYPLGEIEWEAVMNREETANTGAVVEFLKTKFQERELRKLSESINKMVDSGDAYNATAEAVHKHLNAIRAETVEAYTERVDDLFARVFKILENPNEKVVKYLPVSLFDDSSPVLAENWLTIIAGRPGMGKSYLMNYLALVTGIVNKKPVYIASSEMSSEQLMLRFIGTMAGIHGDKLSGIAPRTAEDIERIRACKHIWDNAEIYISNKPGMTPNEIVADVRQFEWNNLGGKKFACVFVDYLTHLTPDNGKHSNQNLVVGEMLKTLGVLKQGRSVVVVAQLNREVEKLDDKRPTAAHIRDSGNVEQDADVICTMYRDDYYSGIKRDHSPVEIIIAKHRHTATGVSHATLEMSSGRFYSSQGVCEISDFAINGQKSNDNQPTPIRVNEKSVGDLRNLLIYLCEETPENYPKSREIYKTWHSSAFKMSDYTVFYEMLSMWMLKKSNGESWGREEGWHWVRDLAMV